MGESEEKDINFGNERDRWLIFNKDGKEVSKSFYAKSFKLFGLLLHHLKMVGFKLLTEDLKIVKES